MIEVEQGMLLSQHLDQRLVFSRAQLSCHVIVCSILTSAKLLQSIMLGKLVHS